MKKILLRFQEPKSKEFGEVTMHGDDTFAQSALLHMRDGLISAGWISTVVIVSETEEVL